jgi:septal ring factor EnvC (AmiA/AmiB activator)
MVYTDHVFPREFPDIDLALFAKSHHESMHTLHADLQRREREAFVKNMTKTMQHKMADELQKVTHRQDSYITHVQADLQEIVRFYHTYEGQIFDVCQSLRDLDKQLLTLSEKRGKAKKKLDGVHAMYEGHFHRDFEYHDEAEGEADAEVNDELYSEDVREVRVLRRELQKTTRQRTEVQNELTRARNQLHEAKRTRREKVLQEQAVTLSLLRETQMKEEELQETLKIGEKKTFVLDRQNRAAEKKLEGLQRDADDLRAHLKEADKTTARLQAKEGQLTRAKQYVAEQTEELLSSAETEFVRGLNNTSDLVGGHVAHAKEVERSFLKYVECPQCKKTFTEPVMMWQSNLTLCSGCEEESKDVTDAIVSAMGGVDDQKDEDEHGNDRPPVLQKDFQLELFLKRWNLHQSSLQNLLETSELFPSLLDEIKESCTRLKVHTMEELEQFLDEPEFTPLPADASK